MTDELTHDERFIIDQIKAKKDSLSVVNAPGRLMNNRRRVDRLRAEQSISFDEFIELLVKLVEKALYEDQVKMSPDEGATINDRDRPINNPYIFFKIISGKTTNILLKKILKKKALKYIVMHSNMYFNSISSLAVMQRLIKS